MNPISIPPASKKFAELLRSASSSYPEYAVWAVLLESPLSPEVRSEIEAVLSEAVEGGLQNLSGAKMASIMERLAEILAKEREEAVVEKREAESFLAAFFRFFQ